MDILRRLDLGLFLTKQLDMTKFLFKQNQVSNYKQI